MKKWGLILIACLALVAAGCGSSSDDNKSSDTGSSADTATSDSGGATSGGTADAGGKTTVDIKDIKFNPQTITIKKGQTVKWTNSDGSISHTVTKTGGPGAKFDSGTLPGGKTFSQKFDTAGTIDYVCTIHSGQTGKIVVK